MKHLVFGILCFSLVVRASLACAQTSAPANESDAPAAAVPSFDLSVAPDSGPAASAPPPSAPAPAAAPIAPTPPAPAAAPIAPTPPAPAAAPIALTPPASLTAPMRRPISSEFYHRNRVVAGVGKALTALAPVLAIAYLVSLDAGSAFSPDDVGIDSVVLGLAWAVVGISGRLMWAGADLKMTNAMDDSGVRIRRGAAIAAMVTSSLSWIPVLSVVTTPATWISGGLASARIREGHRVMEGVAQAPAPSLTSFRTTGLTVGMRLRF